MALGYSTVDQRFEESSILKKVLLLLPHIDIIHTGIGLMNRQPVRTLVINTLSALAGGGQTYLLRLLSCIPPHLQPRVVILAHTQNQHLWKNLELPVIRCEWASQSLLHRMLFENFRLPRLLQQVGGNVYFASGGLLPFRRLKHVKTIVVFDNMLPFAPQEMRRYPPGYIRLRLWLLRGGFSASFKKTDLLICVSQYAQQVIEYTLPVRQGRIAIIPHSPNDAFRYQPDRPFPKNISGEYVLYVSILDVYKAQIEVIRAWNLLRQQRPTSEKLVFIGPEYPYYAKKVRFLIRELHLENEVLLLGKVPYQELPAYYQYAKINLFASSCENCPNILLEALAAGQPVLCSNYPPMPEFGGNAVEYFDPYIPEQLTQLLLKYLDDPDGRMALGKKALERSLRFQWRESAAKTWNLLAELLEDP